MSNEPIKEERVTKLIRRPWFDGKDINTVIASCKEVWGIGGTDKEAAFYAGVSSYSICRYLDAFPEIKELRKQLQERPILKARQTIIASLNQPEHAKWFLERKCKDEFSIRTEVDNTITINKDPLAETSVEEIQELIKQLKEQKEKDAIKGDGTIKPTDIIPDPASRLVIETPREDPTNKAS